MVSFTKKGRSYNWQRQTGVWTDLQLIGACGHVEEPPLLAGHVGHQNTINKYLGSLSTRGLEKRRRNERGGEEERDSGVWISIIRGEGDTRV